MNDSSSFLMTLYTVFLFLIVYSITSLVIVELINQWANFNTIILMITFTYGHLMGNIPMRIIVSCLMSFFI